ncbi:bifunctional 4-hydroxy-2-oxoglutarate aldolase/2-dehydro-3-deoxy-phosphogluconate aldolase [Ktedonospora formicarum]|uniref:2-dehydro-3-deoxy-phosphogluconate aldolase n=1 Tax=Ktedonospora formicarum TaxID=2778364 RepID=A0A8J3HX23_9CHLR|nr:bifunctional 4-hydroxy-2-oxoglutarate aldolase/2-dehydro-3-deoxy-phosphogluconate aldolase [Ktedonospora formicarum]GHO42615.1 2-dehydro-3-deoxy-phosphogluconate aldolase [Ktedonospora formicarum]
MSTVLERIEQSKIVAIVRLRSYERAIEVANALLAGGVTIVEFTLTGEGALNAIRETRAALGDKMTIGVGTVLNAEAAQASLEVGAQFMVTPTICPDVIATCNAAGVPILCGALTPTEAQTAYSLGADMVKIFPARLGGPAYIRDILAPLPHLRLVPTGGVNISNARAFIDAGAVAIGIGGNIISEQDVTAGNWDAIAEQARSYVEALR